MTPEPLADFGAQSMTAPLRDVLVQRPGAAFGAAFDDPAHGFLHPVDLTVARSEHDGAAHKCTLCYDRQKDGITPACAKACPTESIMFGNLSDLRARADTRVEELHARGQTSAYLYGDRPSGEYSALNAFFLLTEEPAAYNLPPAPRRPAARMVQRYLFSAAVAVAGTIAGAVLLGREDS